MAYLTHLSGKARFNELGSEGIKESTTRNHTRSQSRRKGLHLSAVNSLEAFTQFHSVREECKPVGLGASEIFRSNIPNTIGPYLIAQSATLLSTRAP